MRSKLRPPLRGKLRRWATVWGSVALERGSLGMALAGNWALSSLVWGTLPVALPCTTLLAGLGRGCCTGTRGSRGEPLLLQMVKVGDETCGSSLAPRGLEAWAGISPAAVLMAAVVAGTEGQVGAKHNQEGRGAGGEA